MTAKNLKLSKLLELDKGEAVVLINKTDCCQSLEQLFGDKKEVQI